MPPRAAPIEGILEAAVLLACAEAPRYGYELASCLATEGLVANPVSPGRLYETLADLASKGALDVLDEPSERGPSRRRYQLTEAGEARLDRWVASLDRSAGVLVRLLTRAATHAHSRSHDREGGETMPCQCHCGGPAARAPEQAEAVTAPPASARSVEERLEAIESLLQRLSAR